jgi:hypothetical protein
MKRAALDIILRHFTERKIIAQAEGEFAQTPVYSAARRRAHRRLPDAV